MFDKTVQYTHSVHIDVGSKKMYAYFIAIRVSLEDRKLVLVSSCKINPQTRGSQCVLSVVFEILFYRYFHNLEYCTLGIDLAAILDCVLW